MHEQCGSAKERKNGGETDETAANRYVQPIFLPFLSELGMLESFTILVDLCTSISFDNNKNFDNISVGTKKFLLFQ